MPSTRLFADELGDLLDQGRLVDLVGDLGDDDALRDPCGFPRHATFARIKIEPRPVT